MSRRRRGATDTARQLEAAIMRATDSLPGTRAQKAGIAAAALAPGIVAAGIEVSDRRTLKRDPEYGVLFAPPPSGRTTHVDAADGTRLHVEIFGPEDAQRTIVLAHGWTCTHDFWTYQIRALSDRYRIVAYDQRGHGESGSPGRSDFSIQSISDDLEAVLTATLRADERALLVGHSLGAMAIVGWAGRHRASVRKRAHGAVLVNTGVGDLIENALLVPLPSSLGALKALSGRMLLGASAPIPPGGPISRRAVAAITMGPDASPAQIEFCKRMVLSCRRDVRGGTGRTLSRLALYDSIEHLAVPTLVVAGERDRMTPVVHAERLAEHLPDTGDIEVLARCGHMGPVEKHADVTRLIDQRAALTAPALPLAAA